MSLRATASQTVGPYFSIGMSALYGNELGDPALPRLHVRGRVLDGDGAGVSDAMLELWLADAHGRYAHPEDPRSAEIGAGFRGFGRVPTDAQGGFAFSLSAPGPVPHPDGPAQAPHVNALVFMRGLLKAAATRIYLPDHPQLVNDPVLARVPAARRASLIARREARGELLWDVHMQGAAETVFFDY